MKLISGILMTGFLAASIGAAKAGDEIARFDRATHNDGQHGFHYDNLDTKDQKPAVSKLPWNHIGNTPVGPIFYLEDAEGTGPKKDTVSASCDYDQRGNVATFGLCGDLSEMRWDRDGRSYSVSQMITQSHGYGKNRINSPFNATIDDWNDAFAGGGGD
jgi:hypothetical protein